jgi:hypothetical protein
MIVSKAAMDSREGKYVRKFSSFAESEAADIETGS